MSAIDEETGHLISPALRDRKLAKTRLSKELIDDEDEDEGAEDDEEEEEEEEEDDDDEEEKEEGAAGVAESCARRLALPD